MLNGAVSSLGCGADVCLNVALSAPFEGLRAEPGEFVGVVSAGGLPVHDAAGGTGGIRLKQNGKTAKSNYDSSSEGALSGTWPGIPGFAVLPMHPPAAVLTVPGKVRSFTQDSPAYSASVTCSSHVTFEPPTASWIAICVIPVSGAAPCQWRSPGSNQTTSPGRMS